jgi:DNA-binding MarR family transcriptional regulator
MQTTKTDQEKQPDFRVRDQRRAGHHWADNEVIDDFGAQIGPIGYAIYMYLGMHANNDTGRCSKRQSDIAKAFGISEDTVQRHIQKLFDAGLVAKLEPEQKGETLTYLILEVPKRDRHTARCGTVIPQDAARSYRKMRHGEPQDAVPHTASCGTHNRKQDFLQDSFKDGGARPRSVSELAISQKDFWKILEALPSRSDLTSDQNKMHRVRIAAIKSGLGLPNAKEQLCQHPDWRDWKYLELIDSQKEIEFPDSDRKPAESTWQKMKREYEGQAQ